jgi:hypothetical protein
MPTIGFARFLKQFASGGTVTPLSDAQASAGWAFLGTSPPTVEEFNAMMQSFDDKDNWLYENILYFSTTLGSAAPADGVFTALYQGVLALIQNTGTGGKVGALAGTSTVYTLTNVPPLTAYANGLRFRATVNTANLANATLNIDTQGAVPIYGQALLPVQGGELAQGGIASFEILIAAGINGGNPVAIIKDCDGGSMQVKAGTQSAHAGTMGQIQSAASSYAVATGTVNAHVVALNPPLQARVDGMPIRYRSPGVNTGAVTLNDGVGVVSVVGAAHSALSGSEYQANGGATVMWNAALGEYVLLECTGASLQGIGAQSLSQYVSAAQLFNVLKGCTQFVSSSTFTVPALVTLIFVSAVAGGGGGGGGFYTVGFTSQAGGGGGGGGGAGNNLIRIPYAVVPGSVITITIGAAGTPGGGSVPSSVNPTGGGTGGTTTISGAGFNGGVAVTLAGGTGGSPGGVQQANAIGGGGAGGSGGAGFPTGSYGLDGNLMGNGGMGASSPFGGGAGSGRAALGNAISGFSAVANSGAGGGGGGGAYGPAAGNGGAGGAGGAGRVIFEW